MTEDKLTDGRGPGTSGPDGYAHPSEMESSSMSGLGNMLVLLVIAAADFAVFSQVVGAVMRDSAQGLVLATVAGFTVTSLVLAYSAGRALRDRAAGYGQVSLAVVPLLVSVWLLLGTTGYLASSAIDQRSGIERGDLHADTSGSLLFLALYLASGAVAGVGVYLTRNPLRTRYQTAFRAYRKSARQLARTQAPYERALNVVELHARGRQREEQNYLAARAQRLAFSDELKHYAAILTFDRLNAPSEADGMTLGRRGQSSPEGTTPLRTVPPGDA